MWNKWSKNKKLAKQENKMLFVPLFHKTCFFCCETSALETKKFCETRKPSVVGFFVSQNMFILLWNKCSSNKDILWNKKTNCCSHICFTKHVYFVAKQLLLKQRVVKQGNQVLLVTKHVYSIVKQEFLKQSSWNKELLWNKETKCCWFLCFTKHVYSIAKQGLLKQINFVTQGNQVLLLLLTPHILSLAVAKACF